MKRKLQLLMVGCSLALPAAVCGQGTIAFQNLDFENGVFVPAPTPQNPSAVDWVQAMPGWTGYLGADLQSVISFNSLSLSVPNIAILGPDNPSTDFLQGQYYLVLQTGSYPGQGFVSPAIAQTGTIPSGTQTLRFITANPFALTMNVTFAGASIPVLKIDTAANGRPIWGGDISMFAGQTGELRFEGNSYLDNIFFSNQQVPEPNTLSLIALGALLLGLRRARNQPARP